MWMGGYVPGSLLEDNAKCCFVGVKRLWIISITQCPWHEPNGHGKRNHVNSPKLMTWHIICYCVYCNKSLEKIKIGSKHPERASWRHINYIWYIPYIYISFSIAGSSVITSVNVIAEYSLNHLPTGSVHVGFHEYMQWMLNSITQHFCFEEMVFTINEIVSLLPHRCDSVGIN